MTTIKKTIPTRFECYWYWLQGAQFFNSEGEIIWKYGILKNWTMKQNKNVSTINWKVWK